MSAQDRILKRRITAESAVIELDRKLKTEVSKLENVETWSDAAIIANRVKTLAGQLERAAVKAAAAVADYQDIA